MPHLQPRGEYAMMWGEKNVATEAPLAEYRVFDGHNDTLPKLRETSDFLKKSDVLEKTDVSVDLPKAREGGMLGGFFAIFAPAPEGSPERDPLYGLSITEDGYTTTPRSAVEHTYAHEFTDRQLARLQQLEREAGEQVAIVRSYKELVHNFESDRFSIVVHFEGAAAIDPQLDNLGEYYEKGLRSLGLVWSRPNAFGTGVPFRFPHSPDTGPGLTGAGKELVRRCNEMGIVLDLAHINEKGFWDVAALSDTPLVVSHAGAYALCPSTRNVTDRQLDAIAESNGVLGVIFEPLNLRADGAPNPDASLTEIARHIDYIVERVGIEHVALGSDFDGAQMPADLLDPSQFPNLFQELAQRGYDHESLQAIAHGNWFRVLRDTWKD